MSDRAAQTPSPELVAVWSVLGVLAVERVPRWAAIWLADGRDGPALVALACLDGGPTDTRQVRDLLPAALAECGVTPPTSEVAHAMQTFSQLARSYRDGKAQPRWVAQKVDEYLDGGWAPDGVLALPLARLRGLDQEWGTGEGRSEAQLAVLARDACLEQVHLFAPVPGR